MRTAAGKGRGRVCRSRRSPVGPARRVAALLLAVVVPVAATAQAPTGPDAAAGVVSGERPSLHAPTAREASPPGSGGEQTGEGEAAQSTPGATSGTASVRESGNPAPADALRALGKGLPSQRLSVGVLSDTPPLSYVSRHDYRTGFDVAIARALCRRLALECRFEAMPSEEIVPALTARRIDFAVASLPITAGLDRMVDFTDPYYIAAARFVAPRSASGDSVTDGGRTRVLGALAGSPQAAFLKKHDAGAQLHTYPNEDGMWIDLALGRLDAVLARAVTAKQQFLSQPIGKGFAFTGAPVSDSDVFGRGEGIAVREGDAELEAALDAALDDLLASSEYREIRDRYLDAEFLVSADRVNLD